MVGTDGDNADDYTDYTANGMDSMMADSMDCSGIHHIDTTWMHLFLNRYLNRHLFYRWLLVVGSMAPMTPLY